ncbi:MAG: thioredoxin-disulfide reductase [Phycisphaeraceae bacterium]|nr:thioredoxin-disulfide reductase [Phycisphaeraceae bacterium]
MSNTDSNVEKVTIIGSGPAGWTAAIYAARANLNPIVYEGVPKQTPTIQLPGGQLMLTTEVENYPGFPEGITGPEMMEHFKKQAQRFHTRIASLDITKCDFSKRPFELHTSEDTIVKSHAVIIATGASANWIGLDNEMRLARSGGGVSACAVCDGALPVFRNRPLAVVGGGDTAMEEASYLTKFASKVYVIHRRGEFRASKVMQKRILENPKAEVIWNTTVQDVLGAEKISGLSLKNVMTGAVSTLDVSGLFIAIGHTPNTQFLKGTGLDFDSKGYLKLIDGYRTYTNIEGVFAAGDVSDQIYRQAITAAGMGCKAAIDAERWLADKGVH